MGESKHTPEVCDAQFREPGAGGISGRCVGPKGHRPVGPFWNNGHSSDPRMFSDSIMAPIKAATGGE